MNADDVNISLSKPAISTVERVGSNPAPASPKSNKRKNHRGGRKTKRKQNSSTGQKTLTALKDLAVVGTVEPIVPIPAKRQAQTNRKKRRKVAKAPTETKITAPDTVTERQDGVSVCILEQDSASRTAQDDSTRPCHHSADSSTPEPSPSRGVDENNSARAETSHAISVAKQESVSSREGASGDIAIYGRDGLEAKFKSVTTMPEICQGEYSTILSVSANIHA